MLEDDHTQDIYKQSLVGQILTISERVVTLRGDDPVFQLSSVCSFSVSNSLWSVLLHGIKILWEKVNFLNHIFYKLQLSSSQSCEVHVTAGKGVLDSVNIQQHYVQSNDAFSFDSNCLAQGSRLWESSHDIILLWIFD